MSYENEIIWSHWDQIISFSKDIDKQGARMGVQPNPLNPIWINHLMSYEDEIIWSHWDQIISFS